LGWAITGPRVVAQTNPETENPPPSQRVSPFSSTGGALYNPFSNSLGVNDAGIPRDYGLLFVDPAAGSNALGDGTAQAPFKTITHALKVAQPNMVVLLAPGIYSARNGEKFPLQLKQQVTLQGAPGFENGAAVIYGGGEFLSSTFFQQNATILSEDNAGLSGVTITNPHPSGYGLWIEANSPTVVSNIFTNPATQSIFVTGDSNPRIEGNSIKPDPSQSTRSPLRRPTLPPILSSGNSSSSLFPQGSAVLGPSPGTPVRPSSQQSTLPKVSATTVDLENVPQGSSVNISIPLIGASDGSSDATRSSPALPELNDGLPPSSRLLNPTFEHQNAPEAPPSVPIDGGDSQPQVVSPQEAQFPDLAIHSARSSDFSTSHPDGNQTEGEEVGVTQAQPIPWGKTLGAQPSPLPVASETPPVIPEIPASKIPASESLTPASPEPTSPLPHSETTQPPLVETVVNPSLPAQEAPGPEDIAEDLDAGSEDSSEKNSPEAGLDSSDLPQSGLPQLESLPAPDFSNNQLLPVPNIQQAPIGNVGSLPVLTVSRTFQDTADGPPRPPSRAEVLGLGYRVLVDVIQPQEQDRVKNIVPDAFRTIANGKTVMQVGAFRDRTEADDLVQLLQDSGMPARLEILD